MALVSYALTTVDRAARFMNISTPSSGSDDEKRLQDMINGVTHFIESYLGFRVMKTTHSNEEYDTEKGDSLNLNHFPVVEGEAFTLQRRNSALNEDDWETVDSQYYHIDYESGIIYGAAQWSFARTRRGYRVSYTAGYDFDNSSTYLMDTDAGDLEMAAWQLITGVYNRRRGGSGVKSESIGDYSVEYSAALFEDEAVRNILDNYAMQEHQGTLTPYQY